VCHALCLPKPEYQLLRSLSLCSRSQQMQAASIPRMAGIWRPPLTSPATRCTHVRASGSGSSSSSTEQAGSSSNSNGAEQAGISSSSTDQVTITYRGVEFQEAYFRWKRRALSDARAALDVQQSLPEYNGLLRYGTYTPVSRLGVGLAHSTGAPGIYFCSGVLEFTP